MLYLNLVYTLYMVCKCMSHIYGKIQGLLLQKQKQSLIIPITAFCGKAMFQPKIEQPKLYFTTKAKPSSPNKHQLKYTLTTNSRNHCQTLLIYTINGV